MTLHEKALQIRAAQEEQRLKQEQAYLAQVKEHLENVEQEFCVCFAQHLPLLRRHGIKWSAHLNTPNYIHNGSYIEFEMDGKCLKMDFKGNNDYQYKYTGHYDLDTPDTFSKTKEGFILFLDEFFFSEKPEPVAEHKEEIYPYPPPTDIESALWGELFDYEDWNGNKDTIYRVWRRVHQVLCVYANGDEAAFLKMIKSFKEEKPKPVAEHKEEEMRQEEPKEEMRKAEAVFCISVDVVCPYCHIENEIMDQLVDAVGMGIAPYSTKEINAEVGCSNCRKNFIVTKVEHF